MATKALATLTPTFSPPPLQIGHNPERLNLLKGGIIYSNAVTTVSPTYKVETLERGAAGWLA